MMRGRWKLVYDPEGIFNGDFSNTEFQDTLKMGNWPDNSIWRDRKTGKYYRVVTTQEIHSIGTPTKWRKKMEENGEMSRVRE